MTAMLEAIEARGARAAEALAEATRRALAERLAGELPNEIAVEPAEQGVRLVGRGLVRRFARDARLRNQIQGSMR